MLNHMINHSNVLWSGTKMPFVVNRAKIPRRLRVWASEGGEVPHLILKFDIFLLTFQYTVCRNEYFPSKEWNTEILQSTRYIFRLLGRHHQLFFKHNFFCTVKKCLSLSCELVKWNFTTVGYPLEKSTIAFPLEKILPTPIVGRWTIWKYSMQFAITFYLHCCCVMVHHMK